MNISWGTKIALLYIGFVILIVSLVAGTMFKKTDLVADNYYQQETVFQQRIDAEQATAILNDPLQLSTEAGDLIIQFPQAVRNEAVSGSIHFYAPSDSRADRLYQIRLTGNRFRIAQSALQRIPYEVQVSWTAAGKEYYQSIPLNLR